MASGHLFNGSILCSFLSENNLMFRRTVNGLEIFMIFFIINLNLFKQQKLAWYNQGYGLGFVGYGVNLSRNVYQ